MYKVKLKLIQRLIKLCNKKLNKLDFEISLTKEQLSKINHEMKVLGDGVNNTCTVYDIVGCYNEYLVKINELDSVLITYNSRKTVLMNKIIKYEKLLNVCK